MPPRWLTAVILAWLVLGIGVTLALRLLHHRSVSP